MPEDQATALYGILGGKVDTLTTLPLAINVALQQHWFQQYQQQKHEKIKNNYTKTSFSLLLSMLIGLPLYNRNDYICTTNFKFIISKCK